MSRESLDYLRPRRGHPLREARARRQGRRGQGRDLPVQLRQEGRQGLPPLCEYLSLSLSPLSIPNKT